MKDQRIISAELENLGYALVEIEREPGGLLRVTIENPDYERLITVLDCEKVSHQLSYTLPVENIPFERLEISSPGLDRPVKSAADFERFSGMEVDMKLRVAVGVVQNSSEIRLNVGYGWAVRKQVDRNHNGPTGRQINLNNGSSGGCGAGSWHGIGNSSRWLVGKNLGEHYVVVQSI